MTAALQTEHAPSRRLESDVARAEAEGMVTEVAKVSAVAPVPSPKAPVLAANDGGKNDDGWSFRETSLARPRAPRWQPASIVVATAVVSVVFVALMLALI